MLPQPVHAYLSAARNNVACVSFSVYVSVYISDIASVYISAYAYVSLSVSSSDNANVSPSVCGLYRGTQLDGLSAGYTIRVNGYSS